MTYYECFIRVYLSIGLLYWYNYTINMPFCLFIHAFTIIDWMACIHIQLFYPRMLWGPCTVLTGEWFFIFCKNIAQELSVMMLTVNLNVQYHFIHHNTSVYIQCHQWPTIYKTVGGHLPGNYIWQHNRSNSIINIILNPEIPINKSLSTLPYHITIWQFHINYHRSTTAILSLFLCTLIV